MNLRTKPTREQLRALLAANDDREIHNILWVGFDGEAHIDPLPVELTPQDWEDKMGYALRFRYDCFRTGDGLRGLGCQRE